jgi:CheY-like chemotaxis protein
VHLEIVDHGKGVKAATERSSSYAGAPTLGVGIPGMRERIRQLGGQLEVEFSKDGTRVHASLPVAASTEESAEQSAGELFRDSENFQANSRQRPVRKRILIADDHEVMRRGVRGLVESQEEWLVCGEAIEGHEVISKTRELHPDLLILDVSMPGMSGIEVALQILKDDPTTRILFFTMHDSPQMIREISNVGAWGYVAKARAGNDLVDAVRIILDGKKFFPRIASAS